MVAQAAGGDVVTAQVDWLQEVVNGGLTSVALIVLFMAAIAVIVERWIHLRPSRFVSPQILEALRKTGQSGDWDLLRSEASGNCLLAAVVRHMVAHFGGSADLIVEGAFEMVSRRMRMENQINNFLAVIAALAPLLGLLGTMIGMIESFKLVEVYGDEGGASMLAGSISKALITTALGLIIAIFALCVYHWNRFQTTRIAERVEEEVEKLVNRWFIPS